MGMSTYVEGFMEPDEQFKKMYAAYKACEDAGIDPPDEVSEFFNYETPDPTGMKVEDLPTHEYSDEYREGVEIRVADIPKKVTVIRFVNSW